MILFSYWIIYLSFGGKEKRTPLGQDDIYAFRYSTKIEIPVSCLLALLLGVDLVGLRLDIPQRVVRRDKAKVVRHRRRTVELIHITCKHPVVDQRRLLRLLSFIFIVINKLHI